MGTRLGEVKNENLSFDDLDDNLKKQICASAKHASQAEQQGRRGKVAKTKEGGANSDRVVIVMVLAQLVFAAVLGSSRNIKVGCPCFFAFMSSFSGETEFTKFVGDVIATACSRSDPDARQPAPSCAL